MRDNPTANTGEHTGLNVDAFIRLDGLGVIRVAGADAATFLQGQFTSDVRKVSPSHHQLSSWCNPKGRVLACFRICLHDGAFHLLLRRDLIPGLEKRLRLFVLRSAVSVEDASGALECIGVAGPNADNVLRGLGTEPPDTIDGTAAEADITVLRIAGPVPRFVLLGPKAAISRMDAALSPLARRVDAAWWDLLDIEAGLPLIGPETTEEFIPQMLNLQALDGLSFRKGCYPGQEIVARLQYRGRLKRRLYRCHIQGPGIPAAGVSLFAPGQSAEQPAGSVLAASPHPDGGVALLAVIQIDAAEDGPLRLEGPDGPAVDILDLPYALGAP